MRSDVLTESCTCPQAESLGNFHRAYPSECEAKRRYYDRFYVEPRSWTTLLLDHWINLLGTRGREEAARC